MADRTPDTVLAVLTATTDWLARRGVDSPRLDAELLMAHALELERLQLYVQFDRPLTPAERDTLRALVRRRGDREPVAQILGNKEFHSLDFATPPGVLIPRPDTELLAELAIEAVEAAADDEPPLVLDLGSGSGALAVTIAAHSLARVLAVDLSAAAVATTRANAARHDVADRVGVVRSDWYERLPDRFEGGVNVLVSNPPYVSANDHAALAPEIVRYEPREALVAPGGTLDAYHRIAAGFDRWLAPGAAVFVEIGIGQAGEVEAILGGAGLSDLRRHEDLASIERVIAGRWQP
jgi:release factor glutamine methyltransferase